MHYEGSPQQRLTKEHEYQDRETARAAALADDPSSLCRPWTGVDDLATVTVWQACCVAAGITYRQPVSDVSWAERFGRHFGGEAGERLKLALRLFEAIKVKKLWPQGRVVWHDFLAEVQVWPGARAAGRSPPKGQGGAKASGPTTRIHRGVSKRQNSLSAVFDLAIKDAPPGSHWPAVWEALVRIAKAPKPPLPLVGFVEGEGVQYIHDEGLKYLSREAFGRRHRKR
jgi:hypothetical protein